MAWLHSKLFWNLFLERPILLLSCSRLKIPDLDYQLTDVVLYTYSTVKSQFHKLVLLRVRSCYYWSNFDYVTGNFLTFKLSKNISKSTISSTTHFQWLISLVGEKLLLLILILAKPLKYISQNVILIHWT